MPHPHYHVHAVDAQHSSIDVLWGDLDLAERHRQVLHVFCQYVSVDIHTCYQESCYERHPRGNQHSPPAACA